MPHMEMPKDHSLEECLQADAPEARFSPYGWIVTKDLITEPGDGLPTRVGWTGPGTRRGRPPISPEMERALKNGAGRSWRCLDDDRIVYYYGRYIGPDDEDMFGPLWDFAEPDAGATDIQYYEARKGWVSL